MFGNNYGQFYNPIQSPVNPQVMQARGTSPMEVPFNPNYGGQVVQNQGFSQPFSSPQQYHQNLQGKTVDSIDVVKATEIPLDGSISYYPLVDGTAIITKQLSQDGTSKIVVYKPVDMSDLEEKTPKYVTSEELQKAIDELNENIDLDELEDLKSEIKNFKKELKDIANDVKSFKRKD